MPDFPNPKPFALLVTRNFPPLIGGMEKLNRHLTMCFAPDWRPAICGPSGCASFVPEGCPVNEAPLRPLPLFALVAALKTAWLALRLRPKWVVAGSGLTAPIAWLAASLVGARRAVYLHGLDLVAPSRIYQWLWLPFIRACQVVVVNSENTARLARERGVQAARISVVHPGTDIPPLVATLGEDFRKARGFGRRPLLLSVGRFTRRKGLAEFVAQALPRLAKRRPDVLLVIIGDEATDALHGGSAGERARILEAAVAAGVSASVEFLGRCDDATLHAAFQAADCHVFPVLELPGDVEGFGMVALEAAAHGLPTAAFAVGGVPDAVAVPDTGRLVASGDYAGLADAILGLIEQGRDPAALERCRSFARGKSWDHFGEGLRRALRA